MIKLLFDNCANVVADSIEAAEIKYNYMPKAYNEGKLYFSCCQEEQKAKFVEQW